MTNQLQVTSVLGFLAGMDPGVKNILIIVVPFVLISLISMLIFMKFQKGKAANYLQENPDASLIFMKSPKMQITGSTMIESVDGEKPVYTSKGIVPGVFVKPGTHQISASYSDTQVKITKNVHRTWGPALLEVEVEPRKTYCIYFDTATERFQFEEIGNLES